MTTVPYYDIEIKEALSRFKERTGHGLGKIRAALIDMDGTLYDSMAWHARAWHRLMSELGVKCEVDEFFGYEGMTGKATINLLFQREFDKTVTDDEAAELYHRKTLYFRENNKATLMPGARDMVATLRRNNIKTVLVTGSGQATLLSKLNYDFDNAFPENQRITARNVNHGKPDPEPYLKALRLAQVDAGNAIVIENAPLGIKSGVNAGIFTIGVITGPIPREDFVKAGADLIFSSMNECAENISQLLLLTDNDLK